MIHAQIEIGFMSRSSESQRYIAKSEIIINITRTWVFWSWSVTCGSMDTFDQLVCGPCQTRGRPRAGLRPTARRKAVSIIVLIFRLFLNTTYKNK